MVVLRPLVVRIWSSLVYPLLHGFAFASAGHGIFQDRFDIMVCSACYAIGFSYVCGVCC